MEHIPIIREYGDFHGFRTVRFYEAEARKCGQITRRVPCVSADGVGCFALITEASEACFRETACAIDVITEGEDHCLYSGGMITGTDLGEYLSAIGFHLKTVKRSEETIDQICFFDF